MTPPALPLLLWTFMLLLHAHGSSSLKVLVVTIDHRELEGDLRFGNASYQALSAVINYNYAKLHGYDYVYYHPLINETATRLKYGMRPKPLPPPPPPPPPDRAGAEDGGERTHRAHAHLHTHASHLDPEAPTAFHPGLKEFRGSSWCRLPVLWQLVRSNADRYDLLLVIDSDLVMSASQQNVSVEARLADWAARPTSVTWGPKDLSTARIIFFPNSPFGNWEPASGVLLIQPRLLQPSAADMLKDWWDFEWAEKNFAIMHDQDVLWRVFQWSPQTVFALNQRYAAMVAERQFPVDMSIDDWCLRRAWICHVSQSWGKERLRIFHRILHSEVVHHRTRARLSNETRHVGEFFRETLGLIRARDEVQADVLAAAEEMEQSGTRKRIGNHVPQGNEPASVSAGAAFSASPSLPPASTLTLTLTASPSPPPASAAPSAQGSELPDPEEHNNEFHNLNPSKVEEPHAERLAAFRASMAAFAQRVKAAGALGWGQGPKAADAKALYSNVTLGRISHEQFEARYKALVE